MGPGKLVRHMQNPSYTYDKYLICTGQGPSVSSVIDKSPSYSGPSYPSLPVFTVTHTFLLSQWVSVICKVPIGNTHFSIKRNLKKEMCRSHLILSYLDRLHFEKMHLGDEMGSHSFIHQIWRIHFINTVYVSALIKTLSMLKLMWSKAQGCSFFSKPWHVGIHWKALADTFIWVSMCLCFSQFHVFASFWIAYWPLAA